MRLYHYNYVVNPVGVTWNGQEKNGNSAKENDWCTESSLTVVVWSQKGHSHCWQKASLFSLFFYVFHLLRLGTVKKKKNYISYCPLTVAHQSEKIIANMFNFTDVVNTKLNSHIFYKFMCSCYKATFYGQTEIHYTLGW